MKTKLFMYVVLCCVLVFTLGLMAGCKGSDGSAGTSAPTTGTVSGTVKNGADVLLTGVTVTTNPAIAGAGATTAADGSYSLTLPGGSYTVTFTATNYTTVAANVNVANGVQTPANVTLQEAASGKPSVVLVASGNNVGFGTDFTVTATASSPMTGANLAYSWTGINGTSPTNTATATSQDFTSALAGVAAPANDPGTYTAPFEQETRFGLLPINPDTRGTKSVSVTVSDGLGGSTKASVSVNSTAVQAGVRQVAVGLAVYLNSGVPDDATTVWNTVTTPTGTTALSTVGTNNRNPWFVPAQEGQYVVSTSTGSTITLYAGKFVGGITGGGYATKTISKGDPQWDGVWITIPSGASSATYTNWPTLTFNSSCMGCHDGSVAPDKFTPWAGTAHATFFARGIESITSNSDSCVTCHTVGSDGVNIGNGGYDDQVAATGFKYKKYTGAWADLTANYPSVAAVANIQCENCHGAQSTLSGTSSGHKSAGTNGGSPSAARVSYSADDCGVCHASGTGHHNYSEWVESINPDTATSTSRGKGHSKKEQLDAYINPLTGLPGHARSTNDSCVRCHTAQGFAVYADQLASGNAGTIPDSEITWDKTNAQPQTCIACHDPHSDANENQLRISDSLLSSMAGFGVAGVGKGAVCMACHNNRNGIQCASAPTGTGVCTGGALDPAGKTFLHEDAATNGAVAGTASDPDMYQDSMHDASQMEVVMGRDFFFMGSSLPMLSKHANVEDTCVGCHMTLNPQTHTGHGSAAVSGHVFYIKDADVPTLCANCHGNGTVDGEALQTFVENQLDALADKISANLLSRVSGTIYVGSSHTAVTASSVSYYDGSFCFNGTFSGTTCSSGTAYKASLSNITSDAAGANPIFGPSDVLKKASWNWTMIDRDGSKGIHNPTLVTTVLNNTMSQL